MGRLQKFRTGAYDLVNPALAALYSSGVMSFALFGVPSGFFGGAVEVEVVVEDAAPNRKGLAFFSASAAAFTVAPSISPVSLIFIPETSASFNASSISLHPSAIRANFNSR